jgi:predicted dehydrogenase
MIRLGHIGIGGYGHVHLRTARTLEPFGHCKVVAVADPMADREPDLVESLKATGVAVLADPLKLLERGDIDAVIISSPIHYHAPQAIASLRAGKHVYLEKPPCPTLGEWAQIVDAKNSAKRVCSIGFQMQTMPGVHYVKRMLCSGELGELKTVWTGLACRREDGYYNRSAWSGRMTIDGTPVFDGPATNAISHVVHMAVFLAGTSEPAWAKIARVRGSLRRARPIESYDTSYIEGETSTGIPIRLAFTHASARGDLVGLRARGTNGSILLGWDGRVTITPNGGPPRVAHFDYDTHISSLLNFFSAVRDPEQNPLATRVEDTLGYLQMVNGALQSSGGVHSFPPEVVESVNPDSQQHYYRVKGLDEAFTTFANDPEAVPPVFQTREMPWINAADIKPRLPES